MHEFALASNIVDVCLKTAEKYKAKAVIEIHLELGDFGLIVESLLEQSFRIAASGTLVQDSKLVMVRAPGKLHCLDCGQDSEIWFNEEKQREEEEKLNEKNNDSVTNEYEQLIAGLSGVSGYQKLGINLFKCRKCGSRKTDLVGGKELKVKNIKISD